MWVYFGLRQSWYIKVSCDTLMCDMAVPPLGPWTTLVAMSI